MNAARIGRLPADGLTVMGDPERDPIAIGPRPQLVERQRHVRRQRRGCGDPVPVLLGPPGVLPRAGGGVEPRVDAALDDQPSVELRDGEPLGQLRVDRRDRAVVGPLDLEHRRLKIYEAGREDIAQGRIDARVLTLLQQLPSRYELYISSLQSGHSMCVGGGDYAGCNVSNHSLGRAVDIAIVNGEPVRSTSPTSYELALLLASLEGPLPPRKSAAPGPFRAPATSPTPPTSTTFTSVTMNDASNCSMQIGKDVLDQRRAFERASKGWRHLIHI